MRRFPPPVFLVSFAHTLAYSQLRAFSTRSAPCETSSPLNALQPEPSEATVSGKDRLLSLSTGPTTGSSSDSTHVNAPTIYKQDISRRSKNPSLLPLYRPRTLALLAGASTLGTLLRICLGALFESEHQPVLSVHWVQVCLAGSWISLTYRSGHGA